MQRGRLVVEECDAVELARRFGTPLHVVSERRLRGRAREFWRAFEAAWPHGPVRVLPSIKANLALALRAVLTDEGLGCDCFGAGELEAALRCGTDPALISLNGTAKDAALIERAVASGVRITADSVRELELAGEAARRLGRPAVVRVRLRPELPGFDAPSDLFADPLPVWEALERYKPGIPMEDLLAVDLPRDVELRGAMIHLGRHAADPRLWREALRWLAGALAELRVRWAGWEPAEIDVGGGFPMPHDPTGRALERRAGAPELAPPLAAFAAAVGETLAAELGRAGIDPAGRALEVEPGRGLYGDAGIHLTTVLHVKRQTRPVVRTWVETDTSEAFLPDGLLEHNRWRVVAAMGGDGAPGPPVDVVGRSCTFDLLAPDVRLPPLARGDVLAFLDTGAYQDAGASNFNALPRPGVVLVNGAEAEVIRRPETLDDVFARDTIPPRLR